MRVRRITASTRAPRPRAEAAAARRPALTEAQFVQMLRALSAAPPLTSRPAPRH